MNRVLQTAFHIPGTLAANVVIKWAAPFDCQLVHVQAVGSNTNNANLKVGTSSDDDAYITVFDIGDGGVPVEKEAIADFDGAVALSQYPHITDGTIITLTLDYDGSSGTAAADVTIVLTFTEG